ncbi:uncharacterized protein LOC118301033 isoform X2 [Scophthalmus maximus]|uniref:uncharacterized protein LOC118301033 isoform X2 n=1 Tax=Scophthalmus maximus TaxID=52904 RepID=UPI0015E0F2BB|nr:uncharacterized protein LOC118301033 isoform X2 [Scophthalmus maximus]
MGRKKCGVSHTDSGVVRHQRDTPIKTALSRRHRHRRLLPDNQYEALPEETEVEETIVPTDKPTSPVWCKSVSHRVVSPASPTNKKTGYHVSAARHTTIHMTPDTDAFKGGEITVMEKLKKRQNTAETPESIASSGMETDSTFTFDDDVEDTSAPSYLRSLPSPEIFRKENYEETLTFPIDEELLDLHLPIKNSTLLDVSDAQTIHMHDPPNISTITESSTLLTETNCAIRNDRAPEPETKIQRKSLKSDNQAKTCKRKTPIKLTNKRLFLCKKKVSFKTPVIAEILQAKDVPATKSTVHITSETAHTPGPAERTRPDAETSGAGETTSEDGTLRLRVTLKRPEQSSPEKAKFFDFVSDSDRDLFFQRARRRCVKLQSITLFPVTAAENTDASVL